MIKKSNRLTATEFNQYFKSGRRYHSPLFTLVFNKSSDFHGAVVVGKKVAKQAVKRNRLRRQLYSLLYRYHKGKAVVGVFILLTKPPALKADFSQLKAELDQLLNQVADK